MKIYVASSIKNYAEVENIYDVLEAAGHEITHKWTSRRVNPEWDEETKATYLRKCGREDLIGVAKADVLLLVNHAEAHDAMTEFGIALGMQKPTLVLYPERRSSVFFQYAMDEFDNVTAVVTRINNADVVLKKLTKVVGLLGGGNGTPPTESIH